jgi:hypothetical protein
VNVHSRLILRPRYMQLGVVGSKLKRLSTWSMWVKHFLQPTIFGSPTVAHIYQRFVNKEWEKTFVMLLLFKFNNKMNTRKWFSMNLCCRISYIKNHYHCLRTLIWGEIKVISSVVGRWCSEMTPKADGISESLELKWKFSGMMKILKMNTTSSLPNTEHSVASITGNV